MSTARYYVDCPQCGGDGYSGHECFEDSCCCIDEDDERCFRCKGEGGWYQDTPPDDEAYDE